MNNKKQMSKIKRSRKKKKYCICPLFQIKIISNDTIQVRKLKLQLLHEQQLLSLHIIQSHNVHLAELYFDITFTNKEIILTHHHPIILLVAEL